MATVKSRLFLAAVVCAVILMGSVSYAHVRVGIGFGTHIGGGWPGYGWNGGWYWSDGPAGCWPWHSHYYDPVWVYDYHPIVVGPPVVVERHVVVNEHVAPRPAGEPKSTVLSEAQKRKRSESLERLRIGDDGSRISATQELTGYAGDGKVRQALERALLSDRDPGVRAGAATALAKQSGKKAVPVLKQARAQDADRQVQQAAYKALIMIEGY